MKKKWIALFLLTALIGGGLMINGHAMAEDVWMLAVHVGKGDALLIGVDDAVCLRHVSGHFRKETSSGRCGRGAGHETSVAESGRSYSAGVSHA